MAVMPYCFALIPRFVVSGLAGAPEPAGSGLVDQGSTSALPRMAHSSITADVSPVRRSTHWSVAADHRSYSDHVVTSQFMPSSNYCVRKDMRSGAASAEARSVVRWFVRSGSAVSGYGTPAYRRWRFVAGPAETRSHDSVR